MKARKNKSKGGFLVSLLLFFNVIAVVLLAGAYLAPSISPEKAWPIAFLGLAYPALLPLNLIFVVYWLFVRWKFATISLLGILCGWNVLVSCIGFRWGDPAETKKTSASFLRVMTYNVHYWRAFDDNMNSVLNKEYMLDVIRREDPDVLCLQEFYTKKSKDLNTLRSLENVLGTRYHAIANMLPYETEQQGLAIFSKYPIVENGSLLFPHTDRGNEAMYVDIRYQNRLMRVYSVHLQSIGFQPEDYQYLKDVKQISTDAIRPSRRIGSRLKRAFLKRAEQAELLKAHTRQCELPFIVCGDFNDTPVSYALNTVARGLNNTFRDRGNGIGITYNGDFPNFQIDYILTSPGFITRTYAVPARKISDHYAVRSDLEWMPSETKKN